MECATAAPQSWMGFAHHHFLRLARYMRIPALFPLLAVVVLSVPASAQEARPAGGQAMLAPGDSIRVVVWRKPEFSGDFVVAPNGTITHPLYRSVQVGGVPLATAEANLRRFLSRFEENPEFVMEPLVRVAVSGEVDRPRVYALRPETTIAEAIANAGGTTVNGARDRVRVLRQDQSGGQRELVIDLNDPAEGAGLTPVASGDQILVVRKRNFFREVLVPALGIIGSVASLGLLIDRVSRNDTR
jgi:protein involved in polysaccharide export with SLBB domain